MTDKRTRELAEELDLVVTTDRRIRDDVADLIRRAVDEAVADALRDATLLVQSFAEQKTRAGSASSALNAAVYMLHDLCRERGVKPHAWEHFCDSLVARKAAEEREACAKVADAQRDGVLDLKRMHGWSDANPRWVDGLRNAHVAAIGIALAIRARGAKS